MTVTNHIMIKCDAAGCPDVFRAPAAHFAAKRHRPDVIRREAFRWGWTAHAEGKDLCPTHSHPGAPISDFPTSDPRHRLIKQWNDHALR